jgi:hypothetical protein
LVVRQILLQLRDFLRRNPPALIGAPFPDLMLKVGTALHRAPRAIGMIAIVRGESAAFHGVDLGHLLENGRAVERRRRRFGHAVVSMHIDTIATKK